MAKKDKVVELKTKADKISEEHLKRVQDSVNAVNGLQFNIGKIEVQKHDLLHNLIEAKKEISNIQNMLLKEYGSFDVNVENGKINWPKENNNEK
jgi:allophanate hydrolase subunit 1